MYNAILMTGGLGKNELFLILLAIFVVFVLPFMIILIIIWRFCKKRQTLSNHQRLEELTIMQRDGLITEEEFEAKRKEILDEV